jgi:hypothetical protein
VYLIRGAASQKDARTGYSSSCLPAIWNQVLSSDLAGILTVLETRLGPIPWGPPVVEIAPHLGRDAAARQGRIQLSPHILRSPDPLYRLLTLAHECAHQYWRLLVVGVEFLREPMAEFWAFRVLEELGGNSWVRPMRRCARGRLASIAAHPEERSEDRWLGRDVLAIHSLWRRDRETFDVLLRATVDRARNGETRPDVVWGALTPIHTALRRWAESSSLPQPRLERGQLFCSAPGFLDTRAAS